MGAPISFAMILSFQYFCLKLALEVFKTGPLKALSDSDLLTEEIIRYKRFSS